MVTVVTFHAPTFLWTERPHRFGGVRLPHTDLVPSFIASIRRFTPDSSIHLIATESAAIDPMNVDTFDVQNIDPARLMLQRLVQQRRALAQIEGPVAFLDTDILVLRPLSPIFDGTFDIAVTIRDQPRHDFEHSMPYNNGVWFCHGSNRQLELDYLDCLIELNSAMEPEAHAWSGNQFAVRDLLGNRTSGERFLHNDLRVSVLPCSTFNYAPERAEEDISSRHILHFRGEAKCLMKTYAANLLS